MAKSFALDVGEFVRKAKAAPEVVVRKVATDLLTSVVLKTPVGNPSLWKGKPPAGYVGGRARASWGVGLNRPADTSVTLVDKQGRRTIARGQAAIGQWKSDDSIWITSRLPYINRLEYEGHSRQAPAGMVRISVVEFQSFINAAARSLPK
ncbi:hypothetical protein [Luteibacter sp.]|uniref:hypothetical protein n=1 Tax=Luteibacter sp. TaxID=1886636 RepID=UPI002808B2A3|nr:hypothetical protein [Luteibacter sp.]MDQ8051066.1 hypothetical protein [Luteibacter sp.]